MKYTIEADINLPIDKVTALFPNPENYKYWQTGLESIELIEGSPGATGARSRLKFKMGKKDMEIMETITLSNLPDVHTITYESKLMRNIVKSEFTPIGQDKTKCVSHQELQFKGFFKLMGLFFPGAFKKQSMKYLQDFKTFAESKATTD